MGEHPQERIEREMLETIGDSDHVGASKAREAARAAALRRWIMVGERPLRSRDAIPLAAHHGRVLANRLLAPVEGR